MKRIYRNMADSQKQAISKSLTGRSLSPSHRAKLSDSLRKYWAGLEYRPTTDNNDLNNASHEEQS